MSDDIQLPELPPINRWEYREGDSCCPVRRADEGPLVDYDNHVEWMRHYARAAVLADREQRAQPAPGAEYFALENDGHIQLDTRTEQLEIYETREGARRANTQHGSRYTVLKISARRADIAAHSAGNAQTAGDGE